MIGKEKWLLLSAVLLIGSVARADFSIAELLDATKTGVKAFETENPEHVPHFTGYKAWKSAEDAKLKVYVSHEGMSMEFNYLCHKHDTGIECHAQ